MPEHHKQRRLCHINMFKKYYVDCSTPSAPHMPLTVAITSNIAHGEIATQGGEGPIDEGFAGVSVRLRNSDMLAYLDKKFSHLSTEERNDVAELVQEFAHLFPDTPKRPKLVMHDVDVGNACPYKQHPYQVNPQKLLHLQEEIEYMLENKLIEPSNSEWNSPCILVPKPDGSFGFVQISVN